jgi:hypothetical protein
MLDELNAAMWMTTQSAYSGAFFAFSPAIILGQRAIKAYLARPYLESIAAACRGH